MAHVVHWAHGGPTDLDSLVNREDIPARGGEEAFRRLCTPWA